MPYVKVLHSDWSIIGTPKNVVSFFFPPKKRNFNKAGTGVSTFAFLTFIFIN